FAGQLTPLGQLTPTSATAQKYPFITLPSSFKLGDVFSSQDIRVTKTINLHEQINLRLIGEVFNVFNVSNLTGFNYALTSPRSFGKPTQRVGQTFGSGGPRAFQLAARLSF